jgi:hypothetical protein
MFLTVYFATTVVVVHAARVGDLPPALIGWGLAMLSVVLVALALDELRKLVLRQ